MGHVNILKRAKALCDRLVVGVPSDDVVIADKGKPPIIGLIDRITMLEAVRYVDLVLPYYYLEFLTHLQLIKPDLLIVGETWGTDHRHFEAEEWVQANNRRLVKLPRTQGVSSSEIKERMSERARSPE